MSADIAAVRQRLVDAGLIRSKRAAALKGENDLFVNLALGLVTE